MNAAQGVTGGTNVSSMGKKGSQMEELVALSPERRNWRGIFIALLVIAAVFSLIIFSIFLLSPEEEGVRVHGRYITLNDILGNSLQWKQFNGTWSNTGQLVYRDPNGGISVLHVENYTTRALMTSSVFRQLNAQTFSVSPDQQYVLLQSDSNDDGARSYIFDLKTTNTYPLGPNDTSGEPPRLQNIIWTPVSAVSATGAQHAVSKQGIAFVYENDIYYKPLVHGRVVHRITKTGLRGVVYNGVPDWTYANVPELNSRDAGMVFAPGGLYLAFLTFDDSEVSVYRYTWMGDDIKYPTVFTQRYPKASERNPAVSVNVVNLRTLNSTRIQLPTDLVNGSYIGALTWATASDCALIVTNREQTNASTVVCRPPDFACEIVHTEVTVGTGGVLPAEKPIFSTYLRVERGSPVLESSNEIAPNSSSNGQTTYEITNGAHLYLLKRLPVRDGEHGHFRHVVFVSSLDRRPVPLTMGRFEVTAILGWDEANEVVYFMATPEGRPGERQLYNISLKVNVTKTNRTYITSSQPTCMTCDNTAATFKLVNEPDYWRNSSVDGEEEDAVYIPNNCLYNKIYFSEDFSYYVQECLGPESPSVYLVETQTNYKVYVLNGGEILRHRLAQLALPQIKVFSVEIRDGFHAQVRIFIPPGMREGEEVAFPLILHIDSAPGSQLVNHLYQVDWNWYLCSQRSMVVAQVDGRGSGYQGELLRTQLNGKLGTVEVEDQLSVLTYLRDNLKFIDPIRVCAYGWGYGGYASVMALIEDSQQVLQCAVAINPLVSFGYHYSFFTERHIPMNGDYIRALQDADLTMKVGNIKGRNLMLMHGTADTLVHQDHTLMLVRALVDQQLKFWHQVYPDEEHTLTKSLNHVYKTMEWYFDESFGPNVDDDWDPIRLFVFKQ